jgi:hypothetical protein
MAEDLKFIPSDASFDPETVNLLSDAFEHAWHKVQTSGNRLARPGYANMMREVMAKHIFNLAELSSLAPALGGPWRGAEARLPLRRHA